MQAPNAPTRTAFSGPALVRLLARLADLDVQQPGQSLSDRLSQWLGWTDAIALSTALAAPSAEAPAVASALSSSEEDAATVRTRLANAITHDENRAVHLRGRHRAAAPAPDAELPADFTLFRQRYLSLQQSMENDIGDLRSRLRVAVAAQSADMSRLSVVDAVMEHALATRERSLLAQVPMLLGQHFERRKRAHAAQAEQGASNAWLAAFRYDMQRVLLAELDVRFQPIEGLLAALRTR